MRQEQVHLANKKKGEQKNKIGPKKLLLVSNAGRLHCDLCAFYFCRLIGKLTAFLQFQEFKSYTRRVDPSTVTFSLSLQ